MRTLLAITTVVAFSVVPALAGDGKVPDQALARMGLQGMRPLSDTEGLAVRGQAIVIVGGFSNATGGSSSGNILFSLGSPRFVPTFSHGIGVAAGGFSFATAH
jgi:hypothetical protein